MITREILKDLLEKRKAAHTVFSYAHDMWWAIKDDKDLDLVIDAEILMKAALEKSAEAAMEYESSLKNFMAGSA